MIFKEFNILKVFAILIAVLGYNSIFGQTLEGYVYDSMTDEIVTDVKVSLYIADQLVDVQYTDFTGLFLFHKLPEKSYKLVFQKPGYRTYKRYHRSLSTRRYVYKIINLKDPKFARSMNDSIRLGNTDQYFTKEKLSKNLLTFDDPIRSIALSSGAVLIDDRSNAIAYQGIPATFNKWYLDGFEINNPNQYSFQGSNQNFSESGGGMTSSFNNYQSISLTSPGMSSYSAGGVGAAINYESGDIDNFARFGNTATEIGLHKGRFNLGVKFGSPNLLSNLGKEYGWANSRDGAVNINYRNITAKKSDVINFYYNRSYYTRLISLNQVKDVDTYSKRYSSNNWGFTKSFRYKSYKLGFSHSVSSQDYDSRYEFFNISLISGSENIDVNSVFSHLSLENYVNNNSSWGIHINSIKFEGRIMASRLVSASRNDVRYYSFRYHFNMKINNLKYELKLQPRYIEAYRDYSAFTFKESFSPDASFNVISGNGNYISLSHNSQVLINSYFNGYLMKSISFNANFIGISRRNTSIFIKPFFHYFYNLPSIMGRSIFVYTPFYHQNSQDQTKLITINYGASGILNYKILDRLSYFLNITWLDSRTKTQLGRQKTEFDNVISSNQGFNYEWRLKKDRKIVIKLNAVTTIGKQVNFYNIFAKINYFRLDGGVDYQTKRGNLSLAIHNIGNIQNKGFQYFSNLEQDYIFSKQTGMVPFLSYSFTF